MTLLLAWLLVFVNILIIGLAWFGLSTDCVGSCWEGMGLSHGDEVKFISKHFMHCKYATDTIESAWPWLILFISLFLFVQWLVSVELLLAVHTFQVYFILDSEPDDTENIINTKNIEDTKLSKASLLVKPPQARTLHTIHTISDIEIEQQFSLLTSSNYFVRVIASIAYLVSCAGFGLVVFYDHTSFTAAETCVTAEHKAEVDAIQTHVMHFVGFGLLFTGIGLQHFCAALVYYYMVVPSERTSMAAYRNYYIGIEGILILMVAAFIILYTTLTEPEPSIYMEYVLVGSVLLVNVFNALVCCRMLHRVRHLQ